MPADYVRRDLVADEIGEYRRVTATSTHAVADSLLNFGLNRSAVEKGDVLRPWQARQTLTRLLRRVQKPYWRYCKDADGIDPGRDHEFEIFFDDFTLRELSAMTADRKWTVGDALDEMLFVAGEEKFAV